MTMKALSASLLALVGALFLVGCIGGSSSERAPEPTNYTPKFKKGDSPPPMRGSGTAPSSAPPMGDASVNPQGAPSKK